MSIKKLILVLFIIFPTFCLAASSCDLKTKTEFAKLAKNVTASYDIIEENGSRYISIKVYNVVDGIMVNYEKSSLGKNAKTDHTPYFIASFDTVDGQYEIKHYDVSDVYKYKFTVVASSDKCTGSLKSFTLTIPKYNKFSELAECQYYEVSDYLYCQKWVTSTTDYNESTVIDKINRQRESLHKSTTTTSEYEVVNDPAEKAYKRLLRIRILVIIGLTLGIIADIVYIVLFIPKLKDYMRFDIDF